jgi:hypothetical protein
MSTMAVQMARPEIQQIGEAQSLFRDQAAAKLQELADTGQCEPYTVVNFNPCDLPMQGEFKRYKVPSPFDTRLPKNVQRIRLEYEGKERIGHLMTLRDPHMYGKMIGATSGNAPGEAIPQREVQWFTPQVIAYKFLEKYSPIFMAPAGTVLPASPKDARKIHGVLIFKGDIHTIERVLEMEDPEKQIIDVPVASVRMVGKIAHATYRNVPYNLQEYIVRMFAGQKRFADATIARAQQKWSEEQGIRDISDSDRVWYRWAIDMGYAQRPKPGEKTWLSEMITLTNPTELKPHLNLRKCPYCRSSEPEPETPFCQKCNAPMDVFKTFMAGHHVADSYLMTLRGEERELALAERKLRREGFDDLDPAPKTRGPYKAPRGTEPAAGTTAGATEIDPMEEIPAAASTAMPGEEDEGPADTQAPVTEAQRRTAAKAAKAKK